MYVEMSTKSARYDCDHLPTPKAQAADDTVLYEEIKSVIQNKQAVIIGNFNCPNIDWASVNGDREGNRHNEMAEDAFLTQNVTQPTRENNIVKLVFASDPDLMRDCKVGEKLGGCDHHLTRLNTHSPSIGLRFQAIERRTSIVDVNYYPQPPKTS